MKIFHLVGAINTLTFLYAGYSPLILVFFTGVWVGCAHHPFAFYFASSWPFAVEDLPFCGDGGFTGKCFVLSGITTTPET